MHIPSLYINTIYICIYLCRYPSMDIWTWLPALVAGSWPVLSDFWLPASGFQFLASSFWQPAIWLPANGFWFLVSGYWLPRDIPISEFMGTP